MRNCNGEVIWQKDIDLVKNNLTKTKIHFDYEVELQNETNIIDILPQIEKEILIHTSSNILSCELIFSNGIYALGRAPFDKIDTNQRFCVTAPSNLNCLPMNGIMTALCYFNSCDEMAILQSIKELFDDQTSFLGATNTTNDIQRVTFLGQRMVKDFDYNPPRLDESNGVVAGFGSTISAQEKTLTLSLLGGFLISGLAFLSCMLLCSCRKKQRHRRRKRKELKKEVEREERHRQRMEIERQKQEREEEERKKQYYYKDSLLDEEQQSLQQQSSSEFWMDFFSLQFCGSHFSQDTDINTQRVSSETSAPGPSKPRNNEII